MGFLHSTHVQNKSYSYTYLPLLPNLLLAFLLKSALDDLRKLLLQNGYPQGIVTHNINDVLNRNRNEPNSPVSTVPKKDIIILLPYLGVQSDQISKRLKSCVYNFCSLVNLKIIFQSTRRIKSFFPYKDRLNRSQKSRSFIKLVAGTAVTFTWAKRNDGFMIGKGLSLRMTPHQPLLTI